MGSITVISTLGNGLSFGLSDGLRYGLGIALSNGFSNGFSHGMSYGLNHATNYGLHYGCTTAALLGDRVKAREKNTLVFLAQSQIGLELCGNLL
jgi:hypothetical protein